MKTKKKTSGAKKRQVVVVRTYSAGVHIGTLDYLRGTECRLLNAVRLWRWRGANTLSEVAARGVDDEYSRISEPVESVILTQAIEVIPCTMAAAANLLRSRWAA